MRRPVFIAVAGIAAVSCLTIAARADLTEGLIAHYPLNGDACDVSGNNNHGTAHGTFVPDDALDADVGMSMYGNGTDTQYFDSNVPMWNPEVAFSASMWVRLTAGVRLWGSSEGTGPLTYGTYAKIDDATLWWRHGGQQSSETVVTYDCGAPLTDHEWHHLVFVHEAGVRAANMIVYLDGRRLPATVIEDSATAYNSPGDNRSIVFLALRHSRGVILPGFEGLVDEVRIYRRALTAEEAAELAHPHPQAAPVAVPGDQKAMATGWNGATVQLDGSGSYDPDDDAIVAYAWDLDILFDSDGDGDPANDIDSTAADPVADFPIGQTDISLVVTDEHGAPSEPAVGTVEVAAASVAIDVKPGSAVNSVNLSSKGVVPVAFLSDPSVDASQIDPATVTLEGMPFDLGLVRAQGRNSLKLMAQRTDVDGDGDMDVLVHLDTEVLSMCFSGTELTLGALTQDGFLVLGTDTVNLVPGK